MANQYNDYILYRKLEDYGWQIVGRDNASKHNAEYYAKQAGVSCRRRHNAPIYAENNRCVKCVELGHHDVPIGEELTIDIDPLKPVDKHRIEEFWRQKLGLDNIPEEGLDSYQMSSVYVISGEVYYTKAGVLAALPISYFTIHRRCNSTEYEYAQYVRIKIPGRRGGVVYNINGKQFLRQIDIAAELGLSQTEVNKRCNDPAWITWQKLTMD